MTSNDLTHNLFNIYLFLFRLKFKIVGVCPCGRRAACTQFMDHRLSVNASRELLMFLYNWLIKPYYAAWFSFFSGLAINSIFTSPIWPHLSKNARSQYYKNYHISFLFSLYSYVAVARSTLWARWCTSAQVERHTDRLTASIAARPTHRRDCG